MDSRVQQLREASVNARPSISAERALLMTEAYRDHDGEHPIPVARAKDHIRDALR